LSTLLARPDKLSGKEILLAEETGGAPPNASSLEGGLEKDGQWASRKRIN